MMEALDDLCVKRGLTPQMLADMAKLEAARVTAILEGRWTPSPQERDRIAAVFALSREQIAWGHRTEVQHLYGHGPQFGRTP